MKLQSEIKAEITRYSKELRLPVFRSEFEQVAQESAKDGADYETFLLRLMEREYDTRLENRKKAQIRQAGFPAKLVLRHIWGIIIQFETKSLSFATVQNQPCHTFVA